MTATLILKPGKEKSLQRRHPWVYATAVARVTGNPGLGETVKVLSHEQRFLAWAAYSEQSLIRARAWSFVEGEVITADFIARRIAAAVARRTGLARVSNAIRIVFGEADELPG
ncbi:MAG TPA: 23S rRNA (cytosine(1962)-C(5))-methyltransferase RlmI, partial [Burkholderiaceae bacterium]|nr:23S rRNA (cytosine(1962)-C(5))-methyltransferase RlmI [Burkholderiaceae bacterium]